MPLPSPLVEKPTDSSYVKEKLEEIQREKETKLYVTLTADTLDDDSIIEALEKVPTYNRDKDTTEMLNSRIKASSEGVANDTSKAQPYQSEGEGQIVSFF